VKNLCGSVVENPSSSFTGIFALSLLKREK
jgi:hypothetical protein